MFARLLSHPEVREDCELRSPFGFLAFHGGSLERVTDEIAADAARAAGASYYGLVMPPSFRWHVPSNRVDPAHSDALAAFLGHVRVAVAVHGYGRAGMFTTLLCGGRNRPLAAHVAASLRRRLSPHYTVLDDIDAIPSNLRGLHEDNPVNRPPLAGVQLELPPRVRGMGPFWTGWDRSVRTPHTVSVVDALAEAAATWPEVGG